MLNLNNNARLANVVELSSSVRLYVPSTVDVDTVADTSGHIDRALTAFSEWFGGATSLDAVGCWVSPAAGLVKEKVVLVVAYCSETQLSERIDAVLDLAQAFKVELSQEAIALEINNKLYLI